MRSGRGKCPQCKEMIVVDLDAQEIRCPFCNALLKKSKKTVEEVRAENEAREAAAAAREQAAAEEAAAAVQAEATQEEVAAPVDQPVAEEIPAEVPVAEEAPAEEEATQEVANEQADEIGISDEDLAAMDEAPVAEEISEQVEEQAQQDEIGISDEELAAMDDVPASEEAEEPQVFGSIAAEEETPAPAEEDEAVEQEPEAEEEIGSGSIEIADDATPADDDNVVEAAPVEEEEAAAPEEDEVPVADIADEVPAEDVVTDDIPEAIPAEQVEAAAEQDIPETVEEEATEAIPAVVVADEAPVEAAAEQPEDAMMANLPAEEDDMILGDDLAQAPAEDDLVSEDMPMDDDLAAPEEQVAEAEEIAPEEDLAEDVIEEAEAPAQEAEEQEEYVPSEEDMAFAASLSETGKLQTDTVPSRPVGFQKQQNDGGQKSAGKGDKKMDGNSMFKKPIAIIMMILSIAAGAFYFLYYHVAALAVFSQDLPAKVMESLPEIGNDGRYIIMIFWGTLAVVSILAMTSRKMCPAAVFAFIAIAIELCLYLLPIYLADNADFMKLYVDYAEYAEYAMYGMLFLSLIFVGIAVDSAAYRGSRGMSVLPALYFIVALAVYGVFIVFDRYLSGIKVIADIVTKYDKYIIMGVWGAALLLTLVGVHNGRHSRSANGWIFFMGLLLMLVSFLAQKGLDIFDKKFEPSSIMDYPFFNPVIALIGFAGYTAADLRN